MSFGRKHAFFILAFTTGLREGLESIVFLVGVISDVKDLSSLPIPIISALILSRLVGCCFFQGTKKVRVDWFMRGSAILLMFIAAGFFSASMHQLQELDVFGIWSPRADRPWQNQAVWDARGCCNDKTNRFFVLMRALFGWQDQATPIEIFAWFLYWMVGIALDMQCAEIYGHVYWIQACDCVDAATGLANNITVAEPRTSAANLYFSVPAFVVLFRESLEVVIVLAIILQFLQKMKQDGMLEESMYYKFRREGGLLDVGRLGMMMLTSGVLTFLAVNFYKMIFTKEAHERKMKKQMEETLEATRESWDRLALAHHPTQMSFGRKHAFFILAFTTGLREGLESIVFLVGVISDVKDLSSLPIPIISALILSRLVGCCFFQGTKKVRVDWFMRGSAILLMFIAAGFFSASMHQLQELDVFGIWSPRADRPWQNQAVWDARGCCNDKTNRFFVLMRALFGWQDQATPIEIFAWFLYWMVGIALVYCMIRRAKIQLAKKMEEWRRQDAVDASKEADASKDGEAQAEL
eukprot:Skav225188  [mRNA]  locus=scaffold3065:46445:51377:+ [translate_table: standard]